MNPVDTVFAFFAAINHHDSDQLAALMSEDRVFIDSLGGSVHGREEMRIGWRGHFAFCPDSRVSHNNIFHTGNTVAVFGSVGGTIREIRWQTPAAWRAMVYQGVIYEFRVYADNKPPYNILAKSSKPAPK